MEQRNRNDLLWSAAVLGLAIVLAALVGSRAVERLRMAGDEIVVTGSARRPITSDLALWRGNVEAQRASLPEAAADLDRAAEKVRQFIRQRGFADSLVEASAISSYAIRESRPTGEESNRVVGYRLSQRISVTSTDIAAITALSQAAGSLLTAGVPVSPQAPEYYFTRLADLRIAMLGDATEDARVRAQQIAERTGGRIGRIRTVRQGVFQVTPRNSTEISDYGMNDVSAVDKDITAVVRVTFALEN